MISEYYRDQLAQMHRWKFGCSVDGYAKRIIDMAQEWGEAVVLDYGAGKQSLREHLNKTIIKYIPYEPSDPACCSAPDACGFVVCIDVLEHVEPEFIDAVLDDLRRVVLRVGLFTISTKAASKSLPDGRNAHLIQEGRDWWAEKIDARFRVFSEGAAPDAVIFVVSPL
jgi:hypothetical protein